MGHWHELPGMGLFSGPIQEVLLQWGTQSVRGLFPRFLLSLPITPQSKNPTLLANDERLRGLLHTCPQPGQCPQGLSPRPGLGEWPSGSGGDLAWTAAPL